MSPDLKSLKLGERMKRLREAAGMSFDAVAQAVGLSAESIAAFENENFVPDLPQLMAMAEALHVPVGSFFTPPNTGARVEFVRAADRWKVQPATDQATAGNYRYEALSYRLTEKLMSPFLIELSPQQTGDVALSSHEGEEFLFLLAGEVTVTIDANKFAMRAGDSLYFDSRLKHSLQPTGAMPARLLACIAQDHKDIPHNPIERSF